MTEANKTPPVAKVSIYPVEASIWKNATTNGEGLYSAKFQRRYKNAEGVPTGL